MLSIAVTVTWQEAAFRYFFSLLFVRVKIEHYQCLGCEASELKLARELLDCIKWNVRVLLGTGNVTDIFRLKGFFLKMWIVLSQSIGKIGHVHRMNVLYIYEILVSVTKF